MEIMNGAKKDLPNATVVLVLGILSLIFCWCYGFFGLILGIIAVVLAGDNGNCICSRRMNIPSLHSRM